MATPLRIGLVVPHLFLHRDILPEVIFSPGQLALGMAEGLQRLGTDVTLFSPGPADTPVKNATADLSYFERELAARGDTYLELLKKHPLTFVSLARQAQAEVIAAAFAAQNRGELDIVHVYTNEEDIALPFTQLCKGPVVFTHHDPFSFLVKYKHVFPKYKDLNWISMSLAQRAGMPPGTNWVGNIYHGLPANQFQPNYAPRGDYLAYLGRIIEPKGVHLAIQAVRAYNAKHKAQLRLKIAGKHYAGHAKDTYWRERIESELDDSIEYVGFLSGDHERQDFLGNAAALVMPSVFDEPFGLAMIEALACGTPLIGLDSGAIPEVIQPGRTGWIAQKVLKEGKLDESATARNLAHVFSQIAAIDRHVCRADFEARFTLDRMCREHLLVYRKLVRS